MEMTRIVAAALAALCLQISAASCADLAEEPLRQLLRDAGMDPAEFPCVGIALHAVGHQYRGSDEENIFRCSLYVRVKALGPDHRNVAGAIYVNRPGIPRDSIS